MWTKMFRYLNTFCHSNECVWICVIYFFDISNSQELPYLIFQGCCTASKVEGSTKIPLVFLLSLIIVTSHFWQRKLYFFSYLSYIYIQLAFFLSGHGLKIVASWNYLVWLDSLVCSVFVLVVSFIYLFGISLFLDLW